LFERDFVLHWAVGSSLGNNHMKVAVCDGTRASKWPMMVVVGWPASQQ